MSYPMEKEATPPDRPMANRSTRELVHRRDVLERSVKSYAAELEVIKKELVHRVPDLQNMVYRAKDQFEQLNTLLMAIKDGKDMN